MTDDYGKVYNYDERGRVVSVCDGMNRLAREDNIPLARTAIYTYDAYGNHAVQNPDGTANTTSSFIGNINPIRYRGYYCDTETGL